MKKALAIFFIIFCTLNIFAQRDAWLDYNRSSISIILAQGSGKRQNEIMSQKGLVKLSDKYFINTISTTSLIATTDEAILKELSQKHVAAQSLNVWRNIDTLYARTQYNLTEAEIAQMKASARGLETYKDERWFKQLIQNNYILVIKYDNLKSIEDCYKKRELMQWMTSWATTGGGTGYVKRTMEGYIGKATAYLYRIVMDNDNYGLFMQNWDNDYQHNSCDYKIELVKTINFKALGSKLKNEPGNPANVFLNETCEQALSKISQSYPELAATTTISSTRPIKAKIGTREGLAVEDLVKVYTPTETSTGLIKYKKSATLRVKNVADNSGGLKNGEKSTFYNIGWGKCTEGQVLVPQRDHGVSLFAGISLYSALSYRFSVGYSLTRMLNANKPTHTKLFVDFGFSNKYVDQNEIFAYFAEQTGNSNYLNAGKTFTYFYGLGIQYDVQALPFLQISPYLTLMIENSIYTKKKDIDAVMGNYILPRSYGRIFYPQLGLRLPISITSTVKIVPAISYAFKINKMSLGAGASSLSGDYPVNMIKRDRLFIDLLLEIDL